MYSSDVINEILSENDIVDYVSQYVRLKKSGRDYSGLCPFHKEKSPSFHVSGEKQLFHCFGCGVSGNLIQFVMKSEGLDFVEALKLLADRAGVVLPEENDKADYALHEKKKKIYEMNKAAARFFYSELSSEEGKTAVEYFKKRQLGAKTIRQYGLGYSPNDYNALHSYMNSLGYSDTELIEAGLVSEREGRVYDRFRGRVMFPIIDLRGNIIGFGGRILTDTKEINGYKPPKYLNSAETPVFNKGRNLFSLNNAKKDTGGKLILVEGYMDVISVFQAGIINVVATLGTALTEDQAKLMMKYSNEILICYDSDEAGRKATIRAIEIINGVGGKSAVVRLKGAKDPDEYIKANGAESFKNAVAAAVPSTEYRLASAKVLYNTDVPEGKIQFISDAAEILGSVRDSVEVDAYIRKIAAETEISTDAIYSEYKKKKKNAVQREKKQFSQGDLHISAVQKSGNIVTVGNDNAIAAAEKKLLNLIAQNKKFCKKTMEILSADAFSNDVYRKLAEAIYKNCTLGIASEPAMLLNMFDNDDLKTASEVFYNMEVYENNEKTLDDLIISIKKEKIKKQILSEKDPEKLKKLLYEQNALSKRNSELKG